MQQKCTEKGYDMGTVMNLLNEVGVPQNDEQSVIGALNHGNQYMNPLKGIGNVTPKAVGNAFASIMNAT